MTDDDFIIPSMTFAVESIVLHSKLSRYRSEQKSIQKNSISMSLMPREEYILIGEDLRLENPRTAKFFKREDKLVGANLYIYSSEDTSELVANDAESIGSASYNDSMQSDLNYFPASVNFNLFLDSKAFEELCHGLRNSFYPVEVNFDLKGLKFSWEPDGSGKLWKDPKTHLLIRGYSMTFPVFTSSTALEKLDDDERALYSKQQDAVFDIQKKLLAVSEKWSGIKEQFISFVWAAIFFVVVTAVWKWIFK